MDVENKVLALPSFLLYNIFSDKGNINTVFMNIVFLLYTVTLFDNLFKTNVLE